MCDRGDHGHQQPSRRPDSATEVALYAVTTAKAPLMGEKVDSRVTSKLNGGKEVWARLQRIADQTAATSVRAPHRPTEVDNYGSLAGGHRQDARGVHGSDLPDGTGCPPPCSRRAGDPGWLSVSLSE
jgi:hypothetical protein